MTAASAKKITFEEFPNYDDGELISMPLESELNRWIVMF
jgi:hypothetical protein